MSPDLSAGGRATVDQWVTAAEDAAARWPHNAHVDLDDLVYEVLAGPTSAESWQNRHGGVVQLLWPSSGAVVDCPPGVDIAGLARDTYPSNPDPCNRCGSNSPAFGAVVVEAGSVLIGLCLCGACAAHVNVIHDPVFWTFPREANPRA